MLTADRVEFYFTDQGDGPCLVFTHSWALNSDQWHYVVATCSIRVTAASRTTGAATAAPTDMAAAGAWTCSPTTWHGSLGIST